MNNGTQRVKSRTGRRLGINPAALLMLAGAMILVVLVFLAAVAKHWDQQLHPFVVVT